MGLLDTINKTAELVVKGATSEIIKERFELAVDQARALERTTQQLEEQVRACEARIEQDRVRIHTLETALAATKGLLSRTVCTWCGSSNVTRVGTRSSQIRSLAIVGVMDAVLRCNDCSAESAIEIA